MFDDKVIGIWSRYEERLFSYCKGRGRVKERMEILYF